MTADEPRVPVLPLFRQQQRMRDRIAADRAQRYAAFLQQVQNPTEAPTLKLGARTLFQAQGKRTLRLLAEGDSWFDYPLPWPGGDGVISQLQTLLGYPIANMAHYGLEVTQMMGLSLRQEIISRLSDPKIRYDALLFSGGGNDLVGDRFCIWLKDSPPVVPPEQMLDDNAVNSALAVLEAEYRELVALRDKYSPQTVLFLHGYDFPPVTGKGVCGVGPWLKPSLDFVYNQLGVTNPNKDDEYAVVKNLLQRFGGMLSKLAGDPEVERVVVVPTQGTLTPNDADWQNEIHPSKAGFVKIAQRFKDALSANFP